MLGNILIFLHLLGVVALAGAVCLEIVVLTAARSAQNITAARTATAPARFITPLAPLAAALILVTGLWMAGDIGIFGRAWVIVAIVMWLADAAIGSAVLGRRMDHATKLAAATDVLDDALRAALRDRTMYVASMVSVGMFGTFLYLMSSRPGWLGSLVGLVIGVGAGLGAAALFAPTAPATPRHAAEPPVSA